MLKYHITARYRCIADSGGIHYCFYCDLSGMLVCTTGVIHADTQEMELKMAWENEGKMYFNHCITCGKWICDAMYNADTGRCVECSVWEARPNYCVHCGKGITRKATYCSRCGKRLRYGEVVTA